MNYFTIIMLTVVFFISAKMGMSNEIKTTAKPKKEYSCTVDRNGIGEKVLVCDKLTDSKSTIMRVVFK